MAHLAGRDGMVPLVHHLDDRLVLEQVDAGVPLAVGAEDAGLGHGRTSSKVLVPQADRTASRSSSVWVSPELAMAAGLIRSRPSSCSAASSPSTDP